MSAPRIFHLFIFCISLFHFNHLEWAFLPNPLLSPNSTTSVEPSLVFLPYFFFPKHLIQNGIPSISSSPSNFDLPALRSASVTARQHIASYPSGGTLPFPILPTIPPHPLVHPSVCPGLGHGPHPLLTLTLIHPLFFHPSTALAAATAITTWLSSYLLSLLLPILRCVVVVAPPSAPRLQ